MILDGLMQARSNLFPGKAEAQVSVHAHVVSAMSAPSEERLSAHMPLPRDIPDPPSTLDVLNSASASLTPSTDISAIPLIPLYAHTPSSLLPLLTTHLPYSSSAHGTLENHLAAPKDAQPPLIYATFPQHAAEPWTVICNLLHQPHHLRIYASPERRLHSNPSDATQPTMEERPQVLSAVKSFLALHPYPPAPDGAEDDSKSTDWRFGAVSLAWAASIREMMDVRGKRPVCDFYLAPLVVPSIPVPNGFELDKGREHDVEAVRPSPDLLDLSITISQHKTMHN